MIGCFLFHCHVLTFTSQSLPNRHEASDIRLMFRQSDIVKLRTIDFRQRWDSILIKIIIYKTGTCKCIVSLSLLVVDIVKTLAMFYLHLFAFCITEFVRLFIYVNSKSMRKLSRNIRGQWGETSSEVGPKKLLCPILITAEHQ